MTAKVDSGSNAASEKCHSCLGCFMKRKRGSSRTEEPFPAEGVGCLPAVDVHITD